MSNNDDDNIKKISQMLEIGGTMLARHCTECGSPLFRYQGRVLCPVCEDVRDPRAGYNPVPSVQEKEVSVKKDRAVAANTVGSNSGRERMVKAQMDTEYPGSSFSELESLLVSKMTSMAHEIQQEKDTRKISEYLDIIDRCMDIISKMRD